jgi:hypothetical protein
VSESELREVLESAFEESEQQEGGPSKESPEPVRAAPEAAPEPEAKPQRERRPDGKFSGKPTGKPEAGKVTEAAAAVSADSVPAASGDKAPVEEKDGFAKPPQSWKPGAREVWGQLPSDVRAEVYRRERETAVAIQQTAQAREVLSTVQSIQQEFAPALQAEGVDVVTATRNLMQISSRLRFGTPAEKAMTVAQIMQAYGVDVMTLDSILSNSPMPQQAQVQQQQLRDPRVDGLLSQIAQARQTAVAEVHQQAVSEVDQFGSGKDFFNDVREDMADLIEVAARRGVDLSLEQAYERACQMNPEISRVLAQRAAAGQAQNQNRSTARARAASSSVRSTPVTGGVAATPENLRGALEAAWESAAGD